MTSCVCSIVKPKLCAVSLKMADREELRKKLRDKIRNKRDGNDNKERMAQNLVRDPATAMMSMGVDDPEILKHAKSIVKNPQSFMQTAIEKIGSSKDVEGDEDEEAPPPSEDLHESDDEEAPPPPP